MRQISQIIFLLQKEEKESVLSDLKLMPVWVRKIVAATFE